VRLDTAARASAHRFPHSRDGISAGPSHLPLRLPMPLSMRRDRRRFCRPDGAAVVIVTKHSELFDSFNLVNIRMSTQSSMYLQTETVWVSESNYT
jgi:hypothetical protein